MNYTEYVTFNGKKYVSLSVIEKIKAEIEKKIKICENASITCSKRELWVQFTHDKTTYQKVLSIIDQAIKECDKHDCSDCKHQDEVNGEFCYECVKGMADNFEAIKECDT